MFSHIIFESFPHPVTGCPYTNTVLFTMKSPPRPPHLRPLILLILVLLSSSSTLASAPPVRVPYKKKGETYYTKILFPFLSYLRAKREDLFLFSFKTFPHPVHVRHPCRYIVLFMMKSHESLYFFLFSSYLLRPFLSVSLFPTFPFECFSITYSTFTIIVPFSTTCCTLTVLFLVLSPDLSPYPCCLLVPIWSFLSCHIQRH